MKGRLLSVTLGVLLSSLFIILVVSERTVSSVMEDVGEMISRFVG
jgi:hypothetical protein